MLPEELRTTAMMVAMKDALRQSNSMLIALKREMKQKKEELKKQCSCLGQQCRMKSSSTCPYHCSHDDCTARGQS